MALSLRLNKLLISYKTNAFLDPSLMNLFYIRLWHVILCFLFWTNRRHIYERSDLNSPFNNTKINLFTVWLSWKAMKVQKQISFIFFSCSVFLLQPYWNRGEIPFKDGKSKKSNKFRDPMTFDLSQLDLIQIYQKNILIYSKILPVS